MDKHKSRMSEEKAGIGSYKRNLKIWKVTFVDICNITSSKLSTIIWCKKEGLIASSYICPKCQEPMKMVQSNSQNRCSDGFVWKCRRRINKVRHEVERSIRSGSWFENSNLTLEEILKLTYMWTQNVEQQHVSTAIYQLANAY